MKILRNSALLFLSIATVFGADKDTGFRPKAAAEYLRHTTVSGLVIGVDAYVDKEEVKTAFGKLNPNKHGVLPVLVVMQNDSDTALRLSGMQVSYIRPDHRRVEAIPAEEVRYLNGGRPRDITPTPSPVPRIPGLGGKKDKNPLAAWEIEGRAFYNQMLPPHEATHGFFYFHTALDRGAVLYITGIKVAATGQDLFFVEIPLDGS